MSRQVDRTAYDTANRTRAPRGPSGDVADDLITAAYGTGTGHLGTAAASQPSFPRADTSDLVKGTPSAGDEQPDVLRQDTAASVEPPVPPSPALAGLPEGARVVATDGAGRVTHIALNHPVGPTQTMETMGGNNPNYVGTQPTTGLPGSDATHYVSPVPIPEIYHGPDHSLLPDYPTPGSAAAQAAAFQNGIRESNNDLLTGLITGAAPVRGNAGNITGYSPTNGPGTYTNIGDAMDQHDKRLDGDPNPYSGPTTN
jgi:hypothetical protein